MGGAEDAVRLLLSRDAKEAQTIMARVEALNKERRDCQRELAKALPPAEEVADTFDLVVEPSAHKGVIGIVAGQRMRDRGRPSGVCTVVDGVAHCSLRAPEPFDLTEMLALAGPFLKSGGGHRAAAGITFDLKHIAFVRGILTKAAESQCSKGGAPLCDIDGEGVDWMPDMQSLSQLEPFGQAWPGASAMVRGQLEGAPEGFGDMHWTLRLKGVPQPIKWFFAKEKFAARPPKTGETLCLALSPQDHPRMGRSWKVESILESGGAQ
jgi:single-stranded-DNA-specific exonuclease